MNQQHLTLRINHTHLISTWTPAEKLAQLKILDELNVALKLILEQEVQAGNIILRVTRGWPEDDSVIVSLHKPFSKVYEYADIEYQEIDDLHYGRAQYVSKHNPSHALLY